MKIGFLGVNENILFFQKAVIEHFAAAKIEIFYFAARSCSYLTTSAFNFYHGLLSNNKDLQAFCDSVDFVIINQINISPQRLLKIVGIEHKLIPPCSAYLAIGQKVQFKQLANYLEVPTQQFHMCQSVNEWLAVLPMLEYPIVIKPSTHYGKEPFVQYLPKVSHVASHKKAICFLQKHHPVIVEKYRMVFGNFTTLVWRTKAQQNIIISNNTCIYRDGVLLMVQPNYIKKPILRQMIKIIDIILNKINAVGNYVFEFFEHKQMKIVLNNFKIGFDVVGNLDLWNYTYSQYCYYLGYLLQRPTPIVNDKLNNLGELMVIGKAYHNVKRLCTNNKLFIFNDFYKKETRNWSHCHGTVLSNRSYKNHQQNRLLFRTIYQFKAP